MARAAHGIPARLGADAALQAWAAAHARTVGRSGSRAPRGILADMYSGLTPPLDELPLSLDRTVSGFGFVCHSVPVAWSPGLGRRRLAVGGGDITGVWTLDDGAGDGDEVWGGPDPTGWSTSVAWSPDPDRLLCAVGGSNGVIRILSDTGDELSTLQTGHTGSVWSVGLIVGREDILVASGGLDHTVRVAPMNAPDRVRVLSGHTDTVFSVAWSPDPRRPWLASGSADGTVRIWDTDTERCISTLTAHADTVRSVAWSSDRDRPLLATGGHDRVVRIWDPQTGECVQTLSGRIGYVLSLAWSPDPARPLLATGGSDNAARIWDVRSGRCLTAIGHPASVSGVTLTIDQAGRLHLGTGCDDHKARVWVSEVLAAVPAAAPKGGEAARTSVSVVDRTPAELVGDEKATGLAAWSLQAEEPRLVVGDSASTGGIRLRSWDLGAGEQSSPLGLIRPGYIDRRATFSACSLSPTQPLLATVSHRDGSICDIDVWDVDARERRHTWSTDDLGRRNPIAWSPDPHRALLAFAVRREDTEDVEVWNPGNGRVVERLSFRGVTSIAWSPDPAGDRLALGDTEGNTLTWLPDRGRVAYLSRSSAPVTALAWSAGPGQAVLASGHKNGVVSLCDPDTGAPLRTIELPGAVTSLAWWQRPTGRRLLAASCADGLARILDPDTGDSHYSLSIAAGSAEPAESAWLSHRGRMLLAVSIARKRTRVYEFAESVAGAASGSGSPGPAAPTVLVSTALVPTMPAPTVPGTVVRGLLALGAAGLWAPLGLLADAAALTGAARAHPDLYDPRLGALREHPGIARLRSLAWPPQARIGLAALLAAAGTRDQDETEFTAPADTVATARREALLAALETERASPAATPAAPDAVAAAADAITDKTLALLRILGHEAVAADPLLPLRFVHYAPDLPELSPRQADALEAGSATLQRTETARAAGASRTPGVSGISRRGPLHTALPTQLALPEFLRSLRYARGELLHRTHPAHRPPNSGPMTVVLDTTPATFGRCETLLRTAAHLVTVTLWHGGRRPTLITLTHPDRSRELARPGDLLALWTSRTLAPPDLRRALSTAAATTRDCVIVLTASHTAHDQMTAGILTLGPRVYALTAHTPTCAAPPPATHPHHRQLSTADGPDRLAAHLDALLALARRADG